MLIAFAFGQFFNWRFVAFRTILAGGNPEFPALVALDPDAVLVYPAVLYFADALRHDTQIMCPRPFTPSLVNRVKIQTETPSRREASPAAGPQTKRRPRLVEDAYKSICS